MELSHSVKKKGIAFYAPEVVSLLLRLGLALVWLVAGVNKALNQMETKQAIDAYQMYNESDARTLALLMPLGELIVGAMLLFGIFTRLAVVGSTILLGIFILALSSAWSRGLNLDCGCFGGGGESAIGAGDDLGMVILRDVGFLLMGLWLLIRPGRLFAVYPMMPPQALRIIQG